MNRNKYAIFLDFDGTLTSGGIIPQKNIEAIASVQQLGHKVFINTGRSYAFIPQKIVDAVHFDGVVAGLGAYVRLGDEIIESIAIPEYILKKIATYFFSTDTWCVFEGEEKVFYINAKSDEDKLLVENISDFFTAYKDIRISKFVMDGVISDKEIKMLEEDFTIIQYHNHTEFAVKGCSKANGMKMMLKRLSLKRENCIAMGDSANDIDMLKYAGISVAMGNSTDEVKELCDFVSETAANAGVAVALEKYILKNQ